VDSASRRLRARRNRTDEAAEEEAQQQQQQRHKECDGARESKLAEPSAAKRARIGGQLVAAPSDRTSR
jgi:hypothetical protein